MKTLLSALDLLPGWAWALLCSAAISTAAINAHRLQTEQLAHQKLKTTTATEARERTEAHGKELVRASERHIELRAAADLLKLESQRETRRITARYERELDGLRNRPEARAGSDTGGVPEGAAPGVGCTGEGLARRDAEFLTGYARDAARLQLALDQCEAQYGKVEKAVSR